MKPLKVKHLIKQLQTFDPEAPALFHFYAEIGDKVIFGYVPYTKLTTKKVIIKKGKDWYEESKSSKAKKVVVVYN